ncbi:hypothetical protein Salat_2114700 [Sesamum alatum]|uniref:Uncharacterized protein n=1 Tax=Sesamum alatum TaxID=300844 RepID=A0AAE2CGR2_9LAMI|nr:hypothetical protein Salat_2114700 [Sesamum alatum]
MEITNSTTETSQLRPPPPINAQQIKALWRQSGRKIHKVPQLLRQGEHNSDAYDPKVVSFGPYHYGKPELQLCQEAKHFVLQMFVEGGGKSREFFHQGVLEVISDARSCYVEGSTDFYTDEHFAEMMLLDACFLIYYLKIGPQNQLSRLLIYNRLGGLVLSLVGRDIFLLENQIPLQILMLLINLRYERNEAEENLSRFLHESFWGRPYKHHEIQQIQRLKLKKPLHLLEACHQTLVWDWNPEIQPANEDFDSKKHHKTFRSAKNLKAKGIHFKPSSKKSLKDINFKSFAFYGLLELPVWLVSNLSQVFFPNIIAYELCPNNPVGTTVISYVDFMKSLIDSPADVKELREKKILLTSFGSDEEVVRLFRELNTYGIESTYNFLDVEQRIQKHYYSKAKTWMAELIHTYFSSPWSFIAWFAGLWLLILTSVQTYFTINPRK